MGIIDQLAEATPEERDQLREVLKATADTDKQARARALKEQIKDANTKNDTTRAIKLKLQLAKLGGMEF